MHHKTQKYKYITILSFVGLALLLLIQVRYIFHSAHLAEINFNHHVIIALKDIRDCIEKKAIMCSDMRNYLCGYELRQNIRKIKEHEVDSIINSKLYMYMLPLNYEFSISDTITNDISSDYCKERSYYKQTLDGLLEQTGVSIQIEFPNRQLFLFSQIKGIFIISIFIITSIVFAFLILLKAIKHHRSLLDRNTCFMNNMLHELQTPLTNIKLATSLVKKNISDNSSKTDNYIGVIFAEGEKMQGHVNKVLGLQSNQVDQSDEVFDLDKIVNAVCKSYSYKIDELQGSINIDSDNSHKPILSVEGRLEQVFSNLINNAIKYSGDKSPTITISLKTDKQNVKVTVSDTGIGIEKKDLPHIFDIYFRVNTNDVHDQKGFGLGLTLVKQVVERAQKGTIKVASELHKGTTFHITLPLENEDA